MAILLSGNSKYRSREHKNPITHTVKFYPEVVHYSNIGEEQLLDYAVLNSNIERSVIEQCMIAFEEAVETFLLNGHNLQFWPLGSFYTCLRGIGAERREDVQAKNVRWLTLAFVSAPHIKKMLNKQLITFVKATPAEIANIAAPPKDEAAGGGDGA